MKLNQVHLDQYSQSDWKYFDENLLNKNLLKTLDLDSIIDFLVQYQCQEEIILAEAFWNFETHLDSILFYFTQEELDSLMEAMFMLQKKQLFFWTNGLNKAAF